ncbi:hypothetical protein, partial [Thiolapillus sp.]|uniref:hypothetical protein n=1 Tax=Thiolapillus sp. TaxID=2017437 RepID=UPI003AF727F6
PAPAPAPAADGCITDHCRTGSLEKFVLNLLLNMQFPSIEGLNRGRRFPLLEGLNPYSRFGKNVPLSRGVGLKRKNLPPSGGSSFLLGNI